MDYEKNLAKLEKLVDKLDSGKTSFEESLKLYSDGLELAKACLSELKEYKGKIEVLNAELEKLDVGDVDDE